MKENSFNLPKFTRWFNLVSKGEKCRDLAKLLKTSHSTISRLRNGGFPDIETFYKIKEIFDVDLSLFAKQASPSIDYCEIYIRKLDKIRKILDERE